MKSKQLLISVLGALGIRAVYVGLKARLIVAGILTRSTESDSRVRIPITSIVSPTMDVARR